MPQALVTWVQTWIHDRSSFLLAANLLLLVAGCLMEVGSAIVILAPLLMPMAKVYGVDPVHFGIIMTVNLEIGYITPPVGLNLFVAMAAFKAGFVEVSKAALPFVVVMLLGLFIIAAGACLAVLRGVAQGNPHGHSEAVTQCEFTPDAVSLVSASDDTLIKVWDPR